MKSIAPLIIILLISCKKNSEVIDTPTIVDTHSNQEMLEDIDYLDVICFGSCSHQDENQPLWDDIVSDNPDLWIWLGDNIYADTENMTAMRRMYDKQEDIAAYKQMKTTVPIIGVWDDHDYGVNDGDKSYAQKAESRDLMFEFLDVPESDPAWSREGAYQSYVIGEDSRTVKIILLDTRYFRDRVERINREYIPDENGDILGEAQWNWLQEELQTEAPLIIIGNGTQVIPEEHKYEKWANLPTARKRFLELLSTSPSKIVLLSGDRHFGEISKMELDNGKIIQEVTSSGMTHSYEELTDEPNQYRVGQFASQLNYGMMKIDWSSENEPKLDLYLKGDNDQQYEKVTF